ncbi:hypothetical protein BDB00DRAFT_813262 [Zychaea mexicana]|uniref:uncharacterized protein n=1 Tax=Zychaea mexicana TaxID=64656 RepID=UPI0022FE1CC9|nr:uncharacterized protein BDB00DRAFT_813262 [Zychaea mexicana]KAI9495726.1 hypothetical protein BDB00DRAFT_813262 [Zychaea mexicana]
MVFQRIVNYWVSTFITEKLLSSPTFHRMAATTHKHVSGVTNKGSQVSNDFVKAFKENLEKESKNYRK